ncbi:hypothetical protein OG875_28290 [Streptomyces sp. NBC_01498]|uniref:hypothetical protein n=1 Tax=Streptomyces sp. NBC_01498 TaxID=2975870 RepID=UPI002E7AEB6A|nr:hypothetical protein [Streptomyces sp. NBC_01498]WTL28136.1 hypothetical protein OG875_28290 [Streptomyces sp. NBC_01498]
MSPYAFLAVVLTVVAVVLILCGTYLWALHISVRDVDGPDRPAVIMATGDPLKAFVFWRRR